MELIKAPDKTITYKLDESGSEDNFAVDIVENNDSYESWLYNTDCGTKVLMFGITKDKISHEEFCGMVLDNLLNENYIGWYIESYMMEE